MLCVSGGRSAHLQDGYLARWDYWARESQLLHATVPTITTPGNHEVGGGLQAGGHGVPAQPTSCEVAQCLASRIPCKMGLCAWQHTLPCH